MTIITNPREFDNLDENTITEIGFDLGYTDRSSLDAFLEEAFALGFHLEIQPYDDTFSFFFEKNADLFDDDFRLRIWPFQKDTGFFAAIKGLDRTWRRFWFLAPKDKSFILPIDENDLACADKTFKQMLDWVELIRSKGKPHAPSWKTSMPCETKSTIINQKGQTTCSTQP